MTTFRKCLLPVTQNVLPNQPLSTELKITVGTHQTLLQFVCTVK
jgi:hypothetical protein